MAVQRFKNTTKRTTTTSDKLQNQVENYKTRLKSAGVDTEKATDTRNALEKLLNLEEDQNVLSDIFEILDRPRNALFTGIDNALSGDSFGEGLLEGITGETKTSGKDLLLNNTDLTDEEGEMDLVDVLGFGLDWVGDPMDWVLPGHKSASDVLMGLTKKGIKKTAKVADKAITGTANVLDTLEKSKIAKQASKLGISTDELLKINGLTAQDIGTHASNYKALKEGVTDVFAQGKTALGKIKKGIRDIQGKNVLVNDILAQTDDILNNMSYDYILKSFDNATSLKYADDLSDLNNFIKKTNKKGEYNTISKWITENADKPLAKVLKDEQNTLAEDILNVIQSGKDTTVKGKKALRNLIESGSFTGDEKSVQALYDLINQSASDAGLNIGIKTSSMASDKAKDIAYLEDLIKNGNLDEDALRKVRNELTSLQNKNAILNIDDSKTLQELMKNPKFNESLNNLNLKYNLEYNFDEAARLKELQGNKAFMNLAEEHNKAYKTMSDNIKDITGMDYSDIVNRKGYVRKAQGDLADIDSRIEYLTSQLENPNLSTSERELLQDTINTLKQEQTTMSATRTAKSFSSQKYQQPAVVANRQYQESLQKQRDVIKSKIDNLQNEYSDVKKASLKGKKDELELLKTNSEKKAKLDKKLAKANTTVDNVTKKINKTNENLSKITNKVTDDIIDKAMDIQDQSVSRKLVKNVDKVNDINKEIKEITKKLADVDNLDEKTVKMFKKRLDTLDKNLNEAGLSLRKTTDIIDGHVDNTTMKAIEQNVKSMNKYAEESLKLNKYKSAKQQAVDTVRSVNESINDLNNSIDKAIKKTNFDLENISEANDAIIDAKIKELSKADSILKSEQGKDLFNLNFNAGLEDFVNNANYTNETAQLFRDSLAMGVFNDETNIVKTTGAIGEEVPKGFVKVNGKYLSNKLNSVQNMISNSNPSPELKKMIKELGDNNYYMDPRVASLFGIMSNPQENTNALLNLVDKFNTTFKKFSTLTLGFQLRNIIGNDFNMYVSGMPINKIPAYQRKATQALNSMGDITKKLAKGVELTAEEQQTWKVIKQFYEAGFSDVGTAVRDMEKVQKNLQLSNKTNIIDKATDINMKLNNSMDSMNRMALLMYANDNPKYLARLGAESPIQAVKYALMDPSNMSETEQQIIKKIIPFYTFTKQNLMFQATNILKNTPKYKNIMKALNAMYNDLPEDSYYQYQKENMQIPLPFKDDDGNQMFLKANLPLSDLGEFMSSPLKKVTASATPLIKAPVEYTTGKSLYTGQDIKYNTISSNLSKLGLDSSLLSNTADAAELVLNNFGLQNVSTNLIKKVQTILESSSGDKSSNELWSEIFRSLVQNTKQENVRNSGLYDELEQYQALIKQLENQGIDVPTIKEITASNNIKVNNLKRKRANSK